LTGSARHQLRVPALARWLLGLGIVATLAANLAHGWSHGPIGATVAAWPAASLVGSYELLLWLIRTARAGTSVREPCPDSADGPVDQPTRGLRLVPGMNGHQAGSLQAGNLIPEAPGHWAYPVSSPGRCKFDWPMADATTQAADGEADISAAAVAAYRASIENGQRLSERKLAAMFGKTSRRWARHRIAEASQSPAVAAP
jgi:hypothetical protein